ncbi:DUF134 domain-containing protein [Candidatus Woesearchaeota archaeon]|nr:DUF134 domain-containing protein [Candidatus Woesearchaeota archaeon]
MVRPKRFRFIGRKPTIDYFKPRGIPLSELQEINLTHEEYEALRLKEIGNYDQKKAAELMNISQPTYSRILDSARKKVADAIINGKVLKIEGGVFKMVQRKFKCFQCQLEWEVAFGTGRPSKCPNCQSTNIHRVNVETSGFGHHGRGGMGKGKGSSQTGQGMGQDGQRRGQRFR